MESQDGHRRKDRPPLTFAGSTEEGIGVGSTFEELDEEFGAPNLSRTHADLYGAGKIDKHAFFGCSLWATVKDGKVIEIAVHLPGWIKPPAGAPKEKE